MGDLVILGFKYSTLRLTMMLKCRMSTLVWLNKLPINPYFKKPDSFLLSCLLFMFLLLRGPTKGLLFIQGVTFASGICYCSSSTSYKI